MTYSYSKYEWTAFTEADLLQGTNGSSINKGDSFTMPGSATVCMKTYDNGRYLSGDNNERAIDSTGQKAWIDGARKGGQMYAECYHILQGSDGETYYMIEIEVEGYNAPGKGDDFFSFYGAVPPAGVELTVAGTCNVKGNWVDFKCLGAGDKAPANTPPTFTNLPADGILCIDENNTFVIDIDGSDADGDALTYEIVGGRDAAFFEIDPNTGDLSFKNAPDYENPQSGGNNNTYDVKVKVSDGNGGHETKALWVKVKDVDETDPGPVDCIVIEAETMRLNGYKVEHRGDASGGAGIKLCKSDGSPGYAKTTFSGEAGTYDINLTYIDESDGQGFIDVFVNGQFVYCIELDQDNGGNGVDGHSTWSTVTIEDLQLGAGDVIKLKGRGNCSEYARIDKIEVCQDGEVCPEGYAKLDFEGLATGAVVDTQFAGVTISAQRDVNNTPANDAMIFDSANPTGGDHDLGYNGRGNILIVSEDNDSSDPDDAIGGTICFDFDNPSDLRNIVLLDIEENGGTIVLTFEDGSTQTIAIPAKGNNSAQTIDLNAANVTQMKINLAGSGAVDDLCWKPGDAPQPGALEGRVFCDDNDNSVDDAEPGVQGVTVNLYDDTGAFVATTTTDANGDYRFDNLAAGDYTVEVIEGDAGGKVFVDQDVGADDTIDSDVNTATGRTDPVTVAAGATTSDVDAGVEDPGTAIIRGRVFCDDNDNDVDDAEDGVNNVTVNLLNAAGAVIATTTTAVDGSYEFTGLDAGDYRVEFDESTAGGKVLVLQDQGGDDTIDSDASQANGQTGIISVAIGETSDDNDAGVEDPGTASLGDRVFIDKNRNGVQDGGEVGLAGVAVILTDAAGVPVAGVPSQTTDANGLYLFTGLDAGDYRVQFNIDQDVFDFTTQNAPGSDDTNDSDANAVTGLSDAVTLNIGDDNRTVDAGVVSENPVPGNDDAKFCADEVVMVDVLANDVDDEPLTITMVDGQAISEGGSVMTGAGTTVTLSGGKLVVDGTTVQAYIDLDIGDEAIENISYTVEDGLGGFASGNLEATFCGAAESLQDICDSLPAGLNFQIIDENNPAPLSDEAFTLKISGSGDARFDGLVIDEAYCISVFDSILSGNGGTDINNAPLLSGDIFCEGDVPPGLLPGTGLNGEAAADNLDLISWILNQDFNGQGFTDGEIQGAIWGLTDSIIFVAPGSGDQSDAQAIYDMAINPANEGFMAGPDGVVALVIAPDAATQTLGHAQPFIIGVDYNELDCLC